MALSVPSSSEFSLPIISWERKSELIPNLPFFNRHGGCRGESWRSRGKSDIGWAKTGTIGLAGCGVIKTHFLGEESTFGN